FHLLPWDRQRHCHRDGRGRTPCRVRERDRYRDGRRLTALDRRHPFCLCPGRRGAVFRFLGEQPHDEIGDGGRHLWVDFRGRPWLHGGHCHQDGNRVPAREGE